MPGGPFIPTWPVARSAKGRTPLRRERPTVRARISKEVLMPIDITTNYLGLNLRSPLIPSASTLSDDMDTLRALEDAGAAATRDAAAERW